MNIERWLYPRPEVRWSLKQHEGEIVWIPVYHKTDSVRQAPATDKLVNLRSMKTIEEDINTTELRPSFTSSEVSYGRPVDPYTHQRFNYDNNAESPQMAEINLKYRNSLGIADAKVNPGVAAKDGAFNYQSSIHRSEPGFLDFLYKGQKTENIRTHQFSTSQLMGVSQAETSLSGKGPISDKSVQYKIPCLFLKQNQYQTRVLIYFHSNAEDIHLCYNFCKHLMVQLNVCVLAVEYPGYSYFQGVETTEETICENAEHVFDFLTCELGIPQSSFG